MVTTTMVLAIVLILVLYGVAKSETHRSQRTFDEPIDMSHAGVAVIDARLRTAADGTIDRSEAVITSTIGAPTAINIDIPLTALERFARNIRLPWVIFSLLITIIVLVLNVVYYSLLEEDIAANLLSIAYQPVMVFYFLIGGHITRVLLTRMGDKLEPLLTHDVTVLLAIDRLTEPRTRDWTLPLLSGAIAAYIYSNFISVDQLTRAANTAAASLFILVTVVMWFVYNTAISWSIMLELIRRAKSQNILDTVPFRPVAHWSMSIALFVLGAVAIHSGLLTTEENRLLIIFVANALLTLGGFVLFLSGVWGAHETMIKNRQREMNKLQMQIDVIRQELTQAAEAQLTTEIEALSNSMENMNRQKRMFSKASVWPFTFFQFLIVLLATAVPVFVIVYQTFGIPQFVTTLLSNLQ